MSDEKRRRSRVEYKKRILCYDHIASYDGKRVHLNKPILIRLEDISYDGLRIVCNKMLNSGDILIFNLDHDRKLMKIVSEVRWCRYSHEDCEAGLRILNLNRDLLLFLNKLIRDLSIKKPV